MQAMQALVRLPEVAATMRELSREMMKAGILEEMMEETFESMEDTDEMEEEAQSEVDKVLWEITEGKLGEAPLPPVETKEREPAASLPADEEEEEEGELEEMASRLEALRS